MNMQSKPPRGASRNMLESWLSGVVNADPTLRSNVLHNTHPTLAQLAGRKFPADIQVIAVEETPTDLYIVRRFEGSMEPVEPQGSEPQLLRSAIHAVAMREVGFWEKVAANPEAVLEQRLSLKLGPQVKVHVLTETAKTAYLVLHDPLHLQAWKPPAEVMQHVAVKH